MDQQGAIERYREKTERLAGCMPAVTELTYTCRDCGQRKSLRFGRKQIVPRYPKYGYRCMDCHKAREAKKEGA